MEKVALIDRYIGQLKEAARSQNDDQGDLIDLVARTFFDQTELQLLALDYYLADYPNFQRDIDKLIAKLEFEKASLVDELERSKREEMAAHEQRELEKLRLEKNLKASSPVFNNNIHNEANATASAASTLEQTLHQVNQIPPDKLSEEDREELEEKLYALDSMKNSGDKKKLTATLGRVLKYIADKGVEVGIAALPYLGEISKFIQG